MKKLVLSLDHELYRRYKGAQNSLQFVALEIAKFNGGDYMDKDPDVFIILTLKNTASDFDYVISKDGSTYEIFRNRTRNSEFVKYGEIAKVNIF